MRPRFVLVYTSSVPTIEPSANLWGYPKGSLRKCHLCHLTLSRRTRFPNNQSNFEGFSTHGAAPKPHSNTAAAVVALSLLFTATLNSIGLAQQSLSAPTCCNRSMSAEQDVSNLNRGSTTNGCKNLFRKITKVLSNPLPHRHVESKREIDGARNAIGKRTSDYTTIASDGNVRATKKTRIFRRTTCFF